MKFLVIHFCDSELLMTTCDKIFSLIWLTQRSFVIIRVLEDLEHDRCSCVFLICMIQSKFLCVAYSFDQISIVLREFISNFEVEVLKFVTNRLSQCIIFDVIDQITLKSTNYIMIDEILDRIIMNDSLKFLITEFWLSNKCWCTFLFERCRDRLKNDLESCFSDILNDWSDSNEMRIFRTRFRDDEWLSARSIEVDRWFKSIDLN